MRQRQSLDWSEGGLDVRLSTSSWQVCKVGRSVEDGENGTTDDGRERAVAVGFQQRRDGGGEEVG